MTARVSDAFPAAGLLADRPTDPGVVPGFYAATDTDTLYRWDGTAWSEWLTGTSAGATPTTKGCRATRVTAQSIPHNVTTAIIFTATAWETVEMHNSTTNPSRLTVPAGMTGVWSVKAGVGWALAGAADPIRSIRLDKNGAFISDADGHVRMQTPAGTAWPLTFAIDMMLNAGDYLELVAKQTTGAAIDVNVAKLSMTYLGPVA